jgi:LacI family transcriptional regulator
MLKGEFMNIYDIAKRSGVSIATVSRVLNGGKNVSEKTRKKVLGVIDQESYTPNVFARGLGLNSMKMVGILCTDVSDIYYATAVSLVESCLRERGLDVLLCCTGSRLENKKKYLDLLLQKRVDAVMLIGSTFKEDTDNSHIEAAAAQVPVIIINGLVELPGVVCVLCDEKSAEEQNVELLNRRGCSRVLYLYDVLTYSGRQKLAGYRDGCAASGCEQSESLVVKTTKSIESARDKVLELLQAGVAFDAVMASEDILAIGAQKALAQRNISLPIIGFNNSVLAQSATPALTSVDGMLETLCPTAVNLLGDLLEGKPVPDKVVLSAKLVERQTFFQKQKG